MRIKRLERRSVSSTHLKRANVWYWIYSLTKCWVSTDNGLVVLVGPAVESERGDCECTVMPGSYPQKDRFASIGLITITIPTSYGPCRTFPSACLCCQPLWKCWRSPTFHYGRRKAIPSSLPSILIFSSSTLSISELENDEGNPDFSCLFAIAAGLCRTAGSILSVSW